MSIAEQGRERGGPPSRRSTTGATGRRPTSPGERPTRPGDRTPPQDIAAEQCVLGAMLLSKDAIADVAETVRGVDFYRPAHEVIYDAIIDLYGRGEPADPVTVAAELQRRGELQRIGGAPYLHTLSANVPIAANAGYYAEIVREKAILRRLVDAGTKIVAARLRRRGRGRRRRRRGAGRGLQGHRPAHVRGLRPALRHHGRRPRRDRGDRQPRGRPLRRAHRLRRPRRPDQRPAPRPDDHRRGAAGHGQGARARHPAADADRLDDDGRGRGRRPAVRRPGPADARGRGHRGDGRAALLRGRVLRRLGDRRRRPAPVADRDASGPQVDSGRPSSGTTGTATSAPCAAVVTTEEIARTRPDQRGRRVEPRGRQCRARSTARATALPVPPYVLGAWLGDGHSASAQDHRARRAEIPMLHRGAAGYDVRATRGEMLCTHHSCPSDDVSAGEARAPTAAQPLLRRVLVCRAATRDHGTFQALLRKLGVLRDKHIPAGLPPRLERSSAASCSPGCSTPTARWSRASARASSP